MIRPLPLLLVVLLLAGCGSHAAAGKLTPRPHATASQATATVALPTPTVGAPTAAPPSPTPTSKAKPHPTPTAKAVPTHVAQVVGRVLSAAVSPGTVSAGGTLSAQVSTSGPVDKVQVYLSGGPASGGLITFDLTETGSGSWGAQGTAPTAPGTYHYTVGLFVNGRRTIVDNNNWNVTVSGQSAAPARPDNLPLAPGFDYGNPIAVTFTALGKSVSGAEIISTTQTNIAPSVVSNWFETRLPRAGWTIASSDVASGSTSFTIVASTGSTAGSQVCMVQYGGSTIHLYYGTL